MLNNAGCYAFLLYPVKAYALSTCSLLLMQAWQMPDLRRAASVLEITPFGDLKAYENLRI